VISVVVSTQVGQKSIRIVTLFAVLAAGCSSGNQASAEYDPQTGRLRTLAFDATGSGKKNAVGYADGSKLRRIELDLDSDGAIDRWDFYKADGTLEKVGLSQRDDGRMDAEAFYTPEGALRMMRVSTGHNDIFDRTEYYEKDLLVRSEEDTNRDGKLDKWDTYRPEPNVPPSVLPFAITSTAFDETGRGRPTRRLIFGPDGRVERVEVDLDGDGHFTVRPR
jgi:hypothetical protein